VSQHRLTRITAACLLAASTTLIAAAATDGTASAATANPLVIGVDHIDTANQQPFPPYNRLFEYTDFFSRSVRVHQGDTIDFQTQPGSFHIVALARDEAAARRAYPPIMLNMNDMPAPGTGLPKIIFGPGNFPVTGGSTNGGGMANPNNGKGPPVCGAVQFNEAPCAFHGRDDVEIIGPTVGWNFQQQPTTIDQKVVIDATPGRYAYFDMLHPGMRGTLTVVPPRAHTTTQAQVDAASAAQFAHDQHAALAVEARRNASFEGDGTPGHRKLQVFVGASAADDHVEIDEMLPNRPLNVTAGDKVQYVWDDDHAQHTVGFAKNESTLPEPFGYDCSPATPGYQSAPNVFNAPPPTPCIPPGGTQPVPIGDPGSTPSGTALADPASPLDSGLLIGRGYGVEPTAQTWSVKVNQKTSPGSYTYFCTVHPWMTASLVVK